MWDAYRRGQVYGCLVLEGQDQFWVLLPRKERASFNLIPSPGSAEGGPLSAVTGHRGGDIILRIIPFVMIRGSTELLVGA